MTQKKRAFSAYLKFLFLFIIAGLISLLTKNINLILFALILIISGLMFTSKYIFAQNDSLKQLLANHSDEKSVFEGYCFYSDTGTIDTNACFSLIYASNENIYLVPDINRVPKPQISIKFADIVSAKIIKRDLIMEDKNGLAHVLRLNKHSDAILSVIEK